MTGQPEPVVALVAFLLRSEPGSPYYRAAARIERALASGQPKRVRKVVQVTLAYLAFGDQPPEAAGVIEAAQGWLGAGTQ